MVTGMELVLSKLKTTLLFTSIVVLLAALGYKAYKHFNPDSYFDRALQCQRSGQLTEALKYYVIELERDPMSSAAYHNMGLIYSELGDKKEADDNFKKAKEVSAKSFSTKKNLGKTKVLSGDFTGAIKDLSVAISINPADETALRLRGYAYLRSKKGLESIKDFSEAINLNPHAPVNYAFRGRAYVLMHMNENAYKDFSVAIKLNPADKESYARRVAMSMKNGNIVAIEDCLKLLDSTPQKFQFIQNKY